jgi:hypothetical protein
MTVHPALAFLRPALLVAALAAASVPAAAATQLFKCIIDKRTVYQQQACPANAEPAADAASGPAPPAAGTRPASAAASAPLRGGIRPASRPASSAPATPR